MGLSRRRAIIEKIAAEVPKSGVSPLDNLMSDINKGAVIPIISNSFRINQIFRDEQALVRLISEEPGFNDEDLTIDEQLTREWANAIGYPSSDDHNLARVAKFLVTEEMEDSELAKAKYLMFLSNMLLIFAEENQAGYGDLISALKKDIHNRTFSDITRHLDYPRFPEGMDDPLRTLAKLPLPIYITTSYFDFLERALESEGKQPQTQVIFWSGHEFNEKPEHIADPRFEPTVSNPVVYHLYGLEDYPRTLVLSEDDYWSFLITVTDDPNTQNPVVPYRLRSHIKESRLLLLGYQVGDWDYRILQQFLQKYRIDGYSPRGTLIQLKPGGKQLGDMQKSVSYLTQYFGQKRLDVEWTSYEEFIRKLWNEWEKYNRELS